MFHHHHEDWLDQDIHEQQQQQHHDCINYESEYNRRTSSSNRTGCWWCILTVLLLLDSSDCLPACCLFIGFQLARSIHGLCTIHMCTQVVNRKHKQSIQTVIIIYSRFYYYSPPFHLFSSCRGGYDELMIIRVQYSAHGVLCFDSGVGFSSFCINIYGLFGYSVSKEQRQKAEM